MATIDITNWNEKNSASPVNGSNDANYSGQATVTKVQPVKVTWGNSSTNTGAGDCAFTNDPGTVTNEDFVVTQSDESTTRPYEIAVLDTTNKVAWLWVFGDWVLDGTDQIVVGFGGGDGTDYSSPQNASGTNGTGSNPWGQTGIKADHVYHLEASSGNYLDVAGTNDSSSVTVTSRTADGQFGNSPDFDGTDDTISLSSGISYADGDAKTILYWARHEADADEMPMGDISTNKDFIFHDRNTNGLLKMQDSNGNKDEFDMNESTNTWHSWIVTDSGGGAWTAYRDATSLTVNTSNHTGDINGYDTFGDGHSSNFPWTGKLDAIRFYSENKDSDWVQAEQDASPKGGQDFFSWNGSQSTVTSLTVSDSLSFTEATTGAIAATLSDSVGFTESTSTTLAATFSDNVGFSENQSFQLADTLSDNVTFSENLQGKLIDTLTDNLSFSENTATAIAATLKDNLTFSENLNAQIILLVTASDSLTFGETLDSQIQDTLTDQLNISENTLTRLEDTLTDTLDFSENIKTAIFEVLIDQLDFDENVASTLADTLTDTLSFAESTTLLELLAINHPTQALITTKNKFAVMENHNFKKGDLGDSLKATLEDEDGAIDLSNVNKVELTVKDRSGTKQIDRKAVTITDAANGKVKYEWQSGDPIETAGVYRAEFVIVNQNSEDETVPNEGYDTITVEDDL